MKIQTKNDNIKKEENVKVYRHLHTRPEPEHTHEFIEIAYIYSGFGYHKVNNKKYFVQRGDLLIMGFDDVHSFEPDGEMGVLNCLIAPEFFFEQIDGNVEPADLLPLAYFREFSDTEDLSPVINFSQGRFFDIEYLMDAMTTEFQKKEKGYISAIHGYLQVLIIKIFRQSAEKSKSIPNTEKLTPEILKYIEKNYNKKISLEELAKSSFYSPKYFSKIFKECFGKSVTQYLEEIRVNEALKLINTTDLSMEEIGYRVGFSDKKQFYKIFKDIIGKTPGEIRK